MHLDSDLILNYTSEQAFLSSPRNGGICMGDKNHQQLDQRDFARF
jgi:hypothetical protein